MTGPEYWRPRAVLYLVEMKLDFSEVIQRVSPNGLGGDKTVGKAEEEGKCGGRRGYKERAMGWRRKAVTNYCRLAARRKGHREVVG